MEALKICLKYWLKYDLFPDEWPNNPGDKWPYYQSERLEIYKKYVDQLIEDGHAYRCFCTSERLDSMRQEQQDLWLPTKYDQTCRYLTQEEINEKLNEGIPYTVRLKVPKDKEVVFEDSVKGKITVMTKDIDDQVLMKNRWFSYLSFSGSSRWSFNVSDWYY